MYFFGGVECRPYILLDPLFLVAAASPDFIELRFAFLSCFCRVSYVSYLKHIERLGGPHVAVVGAGPAGFYAAQHIAKENRRPSILISD